MIHYAKGEYHQDTVPTDPTSSGFRHGTGFFETIAYNGRRLCHLDRHLDRIHHSLRSYGMEYEAVDFTAVIAGVLERNGLDDRFARVNITYLLEEDMAHPVVTAAPFEPMPYKAYRLALCSDRHISPLNGHKTTSYMFFALAMRQAKAGGFDDAALFDFDDTLLESTTGAILLQKDGGFVKMDSPYRLASTALALAEDILDVSARRVTRDDLASYRNAYLLNSLIGMRPIVAIGEVAFVPDEEPCRAVTQAVLMDEA